jgi:Zn-finger nucleic acid-binding protein
VKLVACPECHAQYDVSLVLHERFACRCGVELENRALKPQDAEILRCASCGAHVEAEAATCGYCRAQVVREPGELSLICPECFARNADAARFCAACGVGFNPEPIPADAKTLPCPGCEGGELHASRVAEVSLAECRGCHGLWVPGEHFERLIARATELRRTAGPAAPLPRVRGGVPNKRAVSYRRCPTCQAFMQRRNFKRSSGVILDVCHKHGTWLDADEIEQIAGFILSGAAPSTALEDEHKRAAEEARASYRRIQREIPDSTWHGSAGGSDLLLRLLRKIFD